MAISFQNNQITFKLKYPSKIKTWIKKVVALEGKRTGQINYVFTNDEELLKTNKQFLNHSTYTDIITFDDCVGDTIHGDIIISIERVMENAEKFKSGFENELHRVMIHGILHLCGYKDKSEKESNHMRLKENNALKLL